LEYLASKNMLKYPIGSSALKNDFYVDDCITGADTIPEALQIQKEFNHILFSSEFKLRKWCANGNHLLQGLDKEDIIPTVQFEDAAFEDCSIKTLGITWNPTIDKLCGKANCDHGQNNKTRCGFRNIQNIRSSRTIFSSSHKGQKIHARLNKG